MDNLFTPSARMVLEISQTNAKMLGHFAVSTEHLLLALVLEPEGIAGKTLRKLNINEADIQEEINDLTGFSSDNKITNVDKESLGYSQKAKEILAYAGDEAKRLGALKIGTEHILLGILSEDDVLATRILINLGLNLEKTRQLLLKKMGITDVPGRNFGKRRMGAGSELQGSKGASKTPTLDNLARDLTESARNNGIDPVIGRNREVQRVIQILSRRTKNNPVLIGEPGVGKTAIAEGLAERIVDGQVPSEMLNNRLMMLDTGSLVAGTKYRGEFEDRLKKVIKEISDSDNIILFVDELHTLIGAGGAEGAIDASNILKPALARGEIQLIGATTLNEYQKYIERDAALERRFATVMVNEPTVDESREILKGLRERYELHHHLKISDEAIDAAVELSNRYITNRFLPDKAIDLVDEASAKVHLANSTSSQMVNISKELAKIEIEKEDAVKNQDFELAAKIRKQEFELRDKLGDAKYGVNVTVPRSDELIVTGEDIAEIVSEWTGVPVMQLTQKESERLVNLEEFLHQRVIGQDSAVSAISRAIRRTRSGLKDPGRPMGSFMFLGPTGVGKTELAKSLADALFGSADNIIRIDMSEYMEKHTTSRLIGSPPGYVGYEEGGQLTEKVRNHPYSVILFDEIEKAHPDVFNLLLQVLDDGYLTDARGRRVDFRNTIIIMTSNLGATSLRDEHEVGFGAKNNVTSDIAIENKIREVLKETYRPEFLNRIDEIVIFKVLTKDEVRQIVKLMVGVFVHRLDEMGISLKLTPSAINLIADKGYNPEYGARTIRRVLQNELEDVMSEQLLSGEISRGDSVTIGAKGEQFKMRVTKSTKKKDKVKI
ncbi:ATP-dependent Clp protease ATP-binding subunit [Xylocopilactobacillus apicola]|uniref:ATP-dependent Clp protease ATP-binding subunit ClpC n=1 Tax=Xylocopilactobacillus apicola TaxID=2932184 RepID=A0AAU9DGF8_9LACO|nr:ATP-dependent Clp protease ATP-binding subunit [Xylocopilactobacillus apicola]BDR59040.1 ATP-dependent Clp protease ATP-binding subunit ClpC [Xylocopilactobacillus apicola]